MTEDYLRFDDLEAYVFSTAPQIIQDLAGEFATPVDAVVASVEAARQ
ncbi:MAG: hypothetical protein JWO31_110 [Phycisphaerales bacterium]|nr:hypothetical protein [Phycisphaerales bacterium]